MQNYNSIDLCKFICSLLVVAIHIPFMAPVDVYGVSYDFFRHVIARVAVPFFFVASGFFLYKKFNLYNISLDVVKKYVMRIFQLYVVWSVIYLPIIFLDYSQNNRSALIDVVSYLRNFFLIGSYLHLWYLQATIVAVVLLTFLLYRCRSIRKIATLVSILYLIGVLGNSWYGLIAPVKNEFPLFAEIVKVYRMIFCSTNNGLFEGLFFVFMGMFFAHFPLSLSLKKSIVCFIVSLLLLVVEYVFVVNMKYARGYDLYFSLVPTIFFGFLIVKKCKLNNGPIYFMMRKISTLIFLSHMLIYNIVVYVMSFLNLKLGWRWESYVATVVFSVIFSISILKLSNVTFFSFLKRGF